jgi:hypothetical protein
MPYCFYTDGGTYNDDHYYFIHNIFQKTSICHSTKVPKNSNIQAYIGRKIAVEPTALPPKNYKVKNEENQICLPYELHYADKTEEETFKQLGDIMIHNMGWGYTCFVSAFAIFLSEKEIKVSKSLVI